MTNEYDERIKRILDMNPIIQLAIHAAMAEPDEKTAMANIDAIVGEMCAAFADVLSDIRSAGKEAARQHAALIAEWKLKHAA